MTVVSRVLGCGPVCRYSTTVVSDGLDATPADYALTGRRSELEF